MEIKTKNPVARCLVFVLAAIVCQCSLAYGQLLGDLTQWKPGRSMRVGSNVWNENDPYDRANNGDRLDRIEAGETFVLADLKGPGEITHIWMTFLHEPHQWVTDGAANHQELL